MRRPERRAAGGWLLAMLMLVLAGPDLSGFEMSPASPTPDDAAMDETGLIWGSRRSQPNVLFTFGGTRWSETPVDFKNEDNIAAHPVAMSRFDDGSVACVWMVGSGTIAVSRHRETESKVIYQGPGRFLPEGLPAPLFCDSRNRLWVTGNQPEVRWVDGNGNSRMVYEIGEADLVKSEEPARAYNPVMAVEDPRGRVWIWSNAAARGTPYASLDGILLCDGDTVVKMPLKGLGGKMLGPIARLDSQYMVVSVLGEGLYRVDVDTWQVDRIGDPVEKAFHIVQNFFRAGHDLYVLAWGRSGGRIWRLSDRTWTRCLTGFALSSRADRAWLVDGKSFLLASAKNVWLFREEKAPQELSWATGLPVESVQRMFLRPDGTIFFLGERQFYCGNYQTEKSPSRVREMSLSKGFVKDAEGSVWCVSARDPGVARRWTGNQWQRFSLPAEFKEEDSGEMVPDTQGRIWFLPRTKDGPAMYFDARTGKGARFDNVHAAYEKLVQDPPQFLNAWPSDADWRPNRACFHNNRIAFRTGSQTLEYFDGTDWRSWKYRHIVPDAQGIGRPYFNEGGDLCVTIRENGWKWDGVAWVKTPADPRHPDHSHTGYDFGPDPVLPEGITSTGNVARDNEGTLWYTRDGMLYSLKKEGLEEAAFDPGEVHPFAFGCSPHQVLVDRTGHTFFSTVPGRMGWFVVCPRKESHSAEAVRKVEGSPEETAVP